MKLSKTLLLTNNFTTCLQNENFIKIEMHINRKELHFALLKLNANAFDIDNLIKYLKNASLYYALPISRIKELQNSGEVMTLSNEAREKFKDSTTTNGEGGELIAYCINEHVLNARKILTKLKLKTNYNDYVKGSDGIYLLKKDDEYFEIILAESKMMKSLEDAIYNAFKSIDRFITGEADGFENTVLGTNLNGEFETQEEEKFIKEFVIPSKDKIKLNKAFSIFIGFEIEDKIATDLEYIEYEEKVQKQVQEEIDRHYDKIFNQIKKDERKRFSFYIYLIPFMNIENIRKRIIEEIKK